MVLNVQWDFGQFDAAFLSVPSNSFGGSTIGAPIADALPPSAPPVLNVVSVALPPALPSAGDPVPDTTVVTAEQPDSIATYGRQRAPVIVAIVASVEAAQELAAYLGRPTPAYWFSGFRIGLSGLSDAEQDALAELELGDQLRVSKRFDAVAQPVVLDLFVEGIEHEVGPDGHTVTLTTSPAVLWEPFELDVSELDDTAYGLG